MSSIMEKYSHDCEYQDHEINMMCNMPIAERMKNRCNRPLCCAYCDKLGECFSVCDHMGKWVNIQQIKHAIKTLRLVEIELFSFCNRKCQWCPNCYIDRKTFNDELDNGILVKVLEELRDNEYKGAITFSRYNEPLSHTEILKPKLRQIKEYLPDCKLITNTNGDYIEQPGILDDLLIDELTIMDYENHGIDWCKDRLASIGAEITEVYKNYVLAKRGDMDILYYTNWKDNRNITDRGGALKEYRGDIRTACCNEPTYFVGINYDGTIAPCCNIRSDVKETSDYIMGDLHNMSLGEILISEKYRFFQNNCAFGIFHEGSPCYTCANKGGRYTRGLGGIRYE